MSWCPACLKQGVKCLWSGPSCQPAVSCRVDRRLSHSSSTRTAQASLEHRVYCGVHPLSAPLRTCCSTVPFVSCVLVRNLTLSISVGLCITLTCWINLDFCKVHSCQQTNPTLIVHQVKWFSPFGEPDQWHPSVLLHSVGSFVLLFTMLFVGLESRQILKLFAPFIYKKLKVLIIVSRKMILGNGRYMLLRIIL